ncbi:MAG: RagB/SusD family nutrient uptake outer membrane protein [Porphyromonas sp.]|nr:RagB/SusD family nutrient uptake outer membrane protein [Porphyromonas sp.]
MKRLIYQIAHLLFAMAILLPLTGCGDVMDITPNDRYSEKTAYASIRNLDLYVKSFYGVLMSPHTAEIRSEGRMSELYTDLMKPTFYNQNFSNNDKIYYEPLTYTQSFILDNWADMYGRIRRINEFIVDYNNGLLSHLPEDEVNIRVGEARFWRAFAYQELIQRYGGVVLRISEDKVDDQNERSKARATESESWDFVISEYKKAADLLPEGWSDQELGRLTKSAAWGLMARAALYAGRWDEALDAVAKVEGLNKHALLDDYSKVFNTAHNQELILAAYFEKPNLQHRFDNLYGAPADFVGHNVGVAAAPTEEFAGSYEIMIDGVWKEFSWDEINAKDIDPWANRDPRFYATILYNGAPWKRLVDSSAKRWEPRKLELYVGGADGFHHFDIYDNTTRSSTTGYIVRKLLQYDEESDMLNILSDQYWIEMRYAEIILIKAEALARKGQYSAAYTELNKLRTTRASVQLTPIAVQTSWEGFLADLQKERIRELGLEGHRFWDLRRWGIAEEVMDGLVRHGVKITQAGTDTFNYEYIEADSKPLSFPKRYTLNPIPLNEFRNNAALEQNELWK